MENTTTQQHFTATDIKRIRNIINDIHESIKYNYLREDWRDDKVNNYESIIVGYSGYYSHIEDCIMAEDKYMHEEQDSDDYVYDEIDECYILECNSVYVNHENANYFTHEHNADASNGIFSYNDEYVSREYMEHNNLVIDVDGDVCRMDDVYYWESDAEYHHNPEYDEDEEQEDSIINSYSYKPSPKYFRTGNENTDSLFFGIELEVERKNSHDIRHGEMAEKIENGHWYFKNDGSLTDGFEIVTHPLTFNYIKQSENQFEESLVELSNNGYNSYNANTCGMHIHLTKKCFSTWHLYRFLKFFVENKEFIVAISQRKLDKLKKWANIEDDNDNELIYKAKKKSGNSERYVAVNLRNNATVEIRIFRGTLNFNSFMKNIEFTHAVFMYTKENSEITLKGFKEYIEYSKDYTNLKKFISLKNL
jgi:hypothetical protein